MPPGFAARQEGRSGIASKLWARRVTAVYLEREGRLKFLARTPDAPMGAPLHVTACGRTLHGYKRLHCAHHGAGSMRCLALNLRPQAAWAATKEELLGEQDPTALRAARAPELGNVRDGHLFPASNGSARVVAHFAVHGSRVTAARVSRVIGHGGMRKQRNSLLERMRIAVGRQKKCLDQLDDAQALVVLRH